MAKERKLGVVLPPIPGTRRSYVQPANLKKHLVSVVERRWAKLDADPKWTQVDTTVLETLLDRGGSPPNPVDYRYWILDPNLREMTPSEKISIDSDFGEVNAAKAERIRFLESETSTFLEKRYTTSKHSTLLMLNQTAVGSRKTLLGTYFNWVENVWTEYYLKVQEVNLAFDVSAVLLVKLDFSNLTTTNPNIEIRQVMAL